jgi:hypothetical protein
MCHGFGAVLLQRIRTGDCLVFIASAADLNELRAGLAQVAAGQGTLGTSFRCRVQERMLRPTKRTCNPRRVR